MMARRAGCPHPAKPHRRDQQARNSRTPAINPFVGAAISRPNRTAGIGGLSVNGTGSWRHVGMPPYGVGRQYGGNPKPSRAAISRPNRTAGPTGPAGGTAADFVVS